LCIFVIPENCYNIKFVVVLACVNLLLVFGLHGDLR
jgi:hypothetical protein